MGLQFELEESGYAPIIEDGMVYTARVASITQRQRSWGTSVDFKFRIVSDDAHDGQDIWGSTSTKFTNHDNCKLYMWSRAILGRLLPAGYRLDTDDLVDRECRIIIEKSEWLDEKVEPPQKKQSNRVKDVWPTKANAAALAAATEETF